MLARQPKNLQQMNKEQNVQNMHVSQHISNEMLAAALSDVGRFMGKKFKDPLNYMYDKKWEWLMGAIKKFNDLNLDTHTHLDWCGNIAMALTTNYDKEETFWALVEAVRWYQKITLCPKGSS